MSDLILQKIKQSEIDGTEKHKKINELENEISSLETQSDFIEKKVETLKENIKKSKSTLLSKKIEHGQILMKIASIEKFLKMKSEELQQAKRDRITSLRNMTAEMDKMAEKTDEHLKHYGLCADSDIVKNRRLEQENKVKLVMDSIQSLKDKIQLYSVTLVRKNQAIADEEKAKQEVEDARKMKEKLELEAENLMMKANASKLHNETDPELQELKDEVKILQSQVSSLIQEGKLSRLSHSVAENEHNQTEDLPLSSNANKPEFNLHDEIDKTLVKSLTGESPCRNMDQSGTNLLDQSLLIKVNNGEIVSVENDDLKEFQPSPETSVFKDTKRHDNQNDENVEKKRNKFTFKSRKNLKEIPQSESSLSLSLPNTFPEEKPESNTENPQPDTNERSKLNVENASHNSEMFKKKIEYPSIPNLTDGRPRLSPINACDNNDMFEKKIDYPLHNHNPHQETFDRSSLSLQNGCENGDILEENDEHLSPLPNENSQLPLKQGIQNIHKDLKIVRKGARFSFKKVA